MRRLRAELDALDRHIPIYLNEERRAEPATVIPAEAYERAVAEAKSSGAAGWLLHTNAGYDLRKRSFFDASSTRGARGVGAPGTPAMTASENVAHPPHWR